MCLLKMLAKLCFKAGQHQLLSHLKWQGMCKHIYLEMDSKAPMMTGTVSTLVFHSCCNSIDKSKYFAHLQ